MDKNYQNQKQLSATEYNVEPPMQPGEQQAVQSEAVASNPYSRLEEWLQEFFGKSFKLDSPESQEKLKAFFHSQFQNIFRRRTVFLLFEGMKECDPAYMQSLGKFGKC